MLEKHDLTVGQVWAVENFTNGLEGDVEFAIRRLDEASKRSFGKIFPDLTRFEKDVVRLRMRRLNNRHMRFH